MAKKSVLIIDENPPFRDYLASKLEEYGLEVVIATNGVDGMGKLTRNRPDLVITDYFLSQRDLVSILKAKQSDTSVAEIPVIVVSSRISRDKLLEITKYGVRKFFGKPLKIDQLWHAVSELLGFQIRLDETPCILETHLNEDILFVEVAMGLNTEKINLLEFKVAELLKIHGVELPRILVMFSGIEISDADRPKLRRLFEVLVNFTRGRVKWVKVLTQSKELQKAVRSFPEYSEMTINDTLEKAMDDLADKAKFDLMLNENLEDRLASAEDAAAGESLELRFDKDKAFKELTTRLNSGGDNLTFAVVDDDFVVQEIIKNTFAATGGKVTAFDDGVSFLQAVPENLDLIFLDLMMPKMTGFQVMDQLRQRGVTTPIIILSALSQKETVVKALGYGVRNYITKPLKPDELIRKTLEAMSASF